MLNQGGIAGAIAGGWEMTTTTLARTGFPVNVVLPGSYIAPDGNNAGTQRPDLVPGVSLTPPGGRTWQVGSIQRRLPRLRDNSATPRAICFADREPGRSILEPAKPCRCGSAHDWNSAPSSTTSSTTRSWASLRQPSTRRTLPHSGPLSIRSIRASYRPSLRWAPEHRERCSSHCVCSTNPDGTGPLRRHPAEVTLVLPCFPEDRSEVLAINPANFNAGDGGDRGRLR